MTIRDITEREEDRRALEAALARQQEMQSELVPAEKLAALGGLVAGIAHEINTPVGITLSAATYLEAETRKADGAYRAATPLAVAMLDIDHFKRINDTWGHDAGDEVLRRVAKIFQERFRTSDVVARFGGEEFCVIAANLGAAETFMFDGQSVSLTISIGISTKVVDNIDAMISAADALLYRAKEGGRNRIEID